MFSTCAPCLGRAAAPVWCNPRRRSEAATHPRASSAAGTRRTPVRWYPSHGYPRDQPSALTGSGSAAGRSPIGQSKGEKIGRPLLTSEVISIGIGGGLTTSPLPHHRTYGSRIRRFGGWRQGETPPQLEPRIPECQPRVHPRCRARSPTPRRMPSRRSTTGHASCPPFRPSAHPRCGLAYPLPRL
jgi:hypothetical protein